jgi:hypothetical protein
VSSFPAPRAWVCAARAAAWLALPSLRVKLAEQLQLREQNRLLEIRCSWQALGCREHAVTPFRGWRRPSERLLIPPT